MNNTRKALYRVVFKFRRQRRFPNERWKARYRWTHDTILVTCRDRFQIESLILNHLNQIRKDDYEIDLKILGLSRVTSSYKKEGNNRA